MDVLVYLVVMARTGIMYVVDNIYYIFLLFFVRKLIDDNILVIFLSQQLQKGKLV